MARNMRQVSPCRDSSLPPDEILSVQSPLQYQRTAPCPDERINQDEGNEITIYTCTQALGQGHTQLAFQSCVLQIFQQAAPTVASPE
jgi:hypothetical protein